MNSSRVCSCHLCIYEAILQAGNSTSRTWRLQRDLSILASKRECILDSWVIRRQGRSWAEGDAREEERLMARLFRLLRCGRLEAARQLCHHVGQPWRAASLGSSAGMGLTPLGASCELSSCCTILIPQPLVMACSVTLLPRCCLNIHCIPICSCRFRLLAIDIPGHRQAWQCC